MKIWTSYLEDKAIAGSQNTGQPKVIDGMQYPRRMKTSLTPNLSAIPFICV
jgi:hypothetical protein